MPKIKIGDDIEMDNGNQLSDVDPQTSAEMEGLENAFDVLAADAASIQLFRRQPGSNKLAFLEDYSPELFRLRAIRDEFGGGDYVAIGKGSNGKAIKRVSFKVDTIFKPKVVEADKPPVTGGQALDGGKFLEIMMTMNTESNNRQMVMMQGFMSAMASAMSGRKDAEPVKITDIVGMFAQLKNLVPDNSVKMIEMLREGIQLGQLNQKEEEPFWKEALKALAPAVVPMLSGSMSATPAALPNAATKEDEQKMMILDLNALAQELVRNAADKVSAEKEAETLLIRLEQLEGKYPGRISYDRVLEFLELPNWFDLALPSMPPAMAVAAQQNKDWLAAVRDAMLKATEGDNSPPASNESSDPKTDPGNN